MSWTNNKQPKESPGSSIFSIQMKKKIPKETAKHNSFYQQLHTLYIRSLTGGQFALQIKRKGE